MKPVAYQGDLYRRPIRGHDIAEIFSGWRKICLTSTRVRLVIIKWLLALLMPLFFVMEVKAAAQNTNYHFGVRWSVNELPSALSVHDILQNFAPGFQDLDARMPISQFVRSGTNSVQLDTFPFEYEPDSELRVSLLYWAPGENPNTDAKTAFEVAMFPGKGHAEPEIQSHDPSAPLQPRESEIRFEIDEDFDTLQVSFDNRQSMPTWCWEQGDVLQDNAATRDSLTQEYRRLYTLFEARDNEALMEASSTMIQELAQASGESEAYVRQRASFNMFFDSPDVFSLDGFPDEPMTLNLGADNRVAWLTRKGVAVPIRFEHVGNEERISNVRLYFIHRDGQWEICR